MIPRWYLVDYGFKNNSTQITAYLYDQTNRRDYEINQVHEYTSMNVKLDHGLFHVDNAFGKVAHHLKEHGDLHGKFKRSVWQQEHFAMDELIRSYIQEKQGWIGQTGNAMQNTKNWTTDIKEDETSRKEWANKLQNVKMCSMLDNRVERDLEMRGMGPILTIPIMMRMMYEAKPTYSKPRSGPFRLLGLDSFCNDFFIIWRFI